MKKTTKKKTKTISQLKKEADKWFSQYIRLRDSDKNGYCRCCTCPKIEKWKYMDAGHWITRNVLSTRYEETNVHGTCQGCNRFAKGKPHLHELHIVDMHGENERNRLLDLSKHSKPMKKVDYEELIEYYKQQVSEEIY